MNAYITLIFSILGLIWWCYTFTKTGRKLINKAIRHCHHQYLDTTVPFSDYEGGWHVCQKCKKRKYIKWGLEYVRLQRLGMIARDERTEAELMDTFTGFSKFLKHIGED